MKQALKGILSAILTPFSEDGSKIDEFAYVKLIKSQIAAGIHGVVLCGSTGEHPALTVAERKRLFEIGSETAKGKTDVIAHVGSSNVRDTLDLTRHAKGLGVDQMLVVTPYFDRLKFADVQRFLEKVVDIAGGPIIYYDTPGITGLDISEAQMVTLRKEGLVSHIKDSPASFTRTMRMLSNPDAPIVLAGSDPALLAVLAHGAPGTIIGASTFIPELCVQLYEAVSVERDLPRALAVWEKLWPIIDFMLLNGYVALAKAGSALRGLPLGEPREPLAASPEASLKQLKSLLAQASVGPLSAL
ncbi:dihydrodipicolinate synthase family protein [Trinickia acidisoli]|uniref:dihydrodipicolinate synthase family protein n=1 Tax=Trinickia acidisoli TaxID=2767482 RepID=UPI001A90701A|nr:dihydrodipicolinate synthase family protein [Trinickia acidisoli]